MACASPPTKPLGPPPPATQPSKVDVAAGLLTPETGSDTDPGPRAETRSAAPPQCDAVARPVPRDLVYRVPPDYRDESSIRLEWSGTLLVFSVATLDEARRSGRTLRGSPEQAAKDICADRPYGGTTAKLVGTGQREVWTCEGVENCGGRRKPYRAAVIPSGAGKSVWLLEVGTLAGNDCGDPEDAAAVIATAAASASSATDSSPGDSPPPEGYVRRTFANVRLLVPSCADAHGQGALLRGPDGSELRLSQDEDGRLSTDSVADKVAHRWGRATVFERHPLTVNGLHGTYVRYAWTLGRPNEKPKTEYLAVLAIPGESSLSVVGSTNETGSPDPLRGAWEAFVGSLRWSEGAGR